MSEREGSRGRNPGSLPTMAERFRLQAVEAGLLAGRTVKQISADTGLTTRQVYLTAHKLTEIQHAQIFKGKSRGAIALLSRTREAIDLILSKLRESGAPAGEWALIVDRLMAAHHREAQCIAALAGEQVEVTHEGALERLRSDLREMGAESLGLGGVN